MGENLANMVEYAQGNDPNITELTETTPTSSSHAASRPFSSSRSTQLIAVVVIPLDRVHKLED